MAEVIIVGTNGKKTKLVLSSSELSKLKKKSNVQVIDVCWRVFN